MEKNNFRYFKPALLVSLILILGIVINRLISILTESLPYAASVNFPTTSATILIILGILNKIGLNFKLTRFLFSVPNMQGRYKGLISFNHPIKEEDEKIPVTLKITQSGSSIKINSVFNKNNGESPTNSESKVANIVKEEDGTFSLIFTYENKGTLGSNEFSPHYGTNCLKFVEGEKNKQLIGHYYTDRIPQTKGKIKVQYIDNKNLNYES